MLNIFSTLFGPMLVHRVKCPFFYVPPCSSNVFKFMVKHSPGEQTCSFLRHRARNGCAWEREFFYLGFFFFPMFFWISRADMSICSTFSYLSEIYSVVLWLLPLSNWDLKSSLLLLGNREIVYPYEQTPISSSPEQEAWFLWFLLFPARRVLDFL